MADALAGLAAFFFALAATLQLKGALGMGERLQGAKGVPGSGQAEVVAARQPGPPGRVCGSGRRTGRRAARDRPSAACHDHRLRAPLALDDSPERQPDRSPVGRARRRGPGAVTIFGNEGTGRATARAALHRSARGENPRHQPPGRVSSQASPSPSAERSRGSLMFRARSGLTSSASGGPGGGPGSRRSSELATSGPNRCQSSASAEAALGSTTSATREATFDGSPVDALVCGVTCPGRGRSLPRAAPARPRCRDPWRSGPRAWAGRRWPAAAAGTSPGPSRRGHGPRRPRWLVRGGPATGPRLRR